MNTEILLAAVPAHINQPGADTGLQNRQVLIQPVGIAEPDVKVSFSLTDDSATAEGTSATETPLPNTFPDSPAILSPSTQDVSFLRVENSDGIAAQKLPSLNLPPQGTKKTHTEIQGHALPLQVRQIPVDAIGHVDAGPNQGPGMPLATKASPMAFVPNTQIDELKIKVVHTPPESAKLNLAVNQMPADAQRADIPTPDSPRPVKAFATQVNGKAVSEPAKMPVYDIQNSANSMLKKNGQDVYRAANSITPQNTAIDLDIPYRSPPQFAESIAPDNLLASAKRAVPFKVGQIAAPIVDNSALLAAEMNKPTERQATTHVNRAAPFTPLSAQPTSAPERAQLVLENTQSTTPKESRPNVIKNAENTPAIEPSKISAVVSYAQPTELRKAADLGFPESTTTGARIMPNPDVVPQPTSMQPLATITGTTMGWTLPLASRWEEPEIQFRDIAVDFQNPSTTASLEKARPIMQAPAATTTVVHTIVHALNSRPDGPIELTLSPAELGKVRLTLQPSDGGMVVSIAVERPEALDLLRRHIDQLGDQLRDLGYQNLQLKFDAQSSGFAGDPDTENHYQNQGSANKSTAGENGPEMPESTQIISTDSGLDIRL